jgi:hypothetical protein
VAAGGRQAGRPAIARHGGKLPWPGNANIKIFLYVFGFRIEESSKRPRESNPHQKTMPKE